MGFIEVYRDVIGPGFRVEGLGSRVQGIECRVCGV